MPIAAEIATKPKHIPFLHFTLPDGKTLLRLPETIDETTIPGFACICVGCIACCDNKGYESARDFQQNQAECSGLKSTGSARIIIRTPYKNTLGQSLSCKQQF